ncbi:MBL fold metallo-hydrolase [Bacillus sp. ISL-47]|uniref:MBL fold metallo-hydrolase n=1 Tax=Bacillus sp. ISL-47 TaxID=2819130 RepID=UPI001BE5530F|nr:MBL fold metallo-hydrolase [Bacillus sp. ISL-47]MBT2687832.1 MBL fold metallo-hydrolase [Bacillus sp. ISL-47]MBT2708091.1 MBL fold metallo-hydrolase [Pseudomonas sp. ISL-84]
MKKPEKLAENLYLIDDLDLSLEKRTGTYVLTEEKLTLIETSASPSVPYILEGLKQLQFKPEEVAYIIVTHIHLDHAGGAGLLLTHCPNAKLIVHPKGARHLSDPSRLIAGARAVYGDKFDELFNPILPVPEEKIMIKEHEEELSIGAGCTLKFFNSPGHANHHFSIFHTALNGMFTGDTAGVTYPQLAMEGIELYLPSTSPNQFDPEKMLNSISMYEKMDLDYIFFGHYGISRDPKEVYKQIREWLEVFLAAGKIGMAEGSSFEQQMNAARDILASQVKEYLDEKGIPNDHSVYEILSVDMEVCSMGLIDYLQKQND